MLNREGKRRIFFDLALILSLVLISLSVSLIMYLKSDTGTVARVYIDGEAVADYPLSEEGEFILGDGSNILAIEDGAAYMRYADCPDGWCKHQGRISEEWQNITCLPNRVRIEIVE